MLKVVASHQPPLVFVQEAPDGSKNFTGFLVDLLPMLLETAGLPLNYSIRYIPPLQAAGGRQLENGSWTGMMGELTSGRADLALYPMTLTAQRAKYIQHMQPFQDGGYGLLVKMQAVNTGYSFLLPFTWQVWLLFLMAMLAVVLLLTGMDLTTRKARHAALEKVDSRKVQRSRKRDKLMGHAIETIMMAVNSGAAPASRSLGVKLLFIAWAIFSVIMLAAYTANLTANLTVNQLAVQIGSLADLAQSSAFFGVPADSSVSSYFTSSLDKAALLLRPRMIEYKDTDDGVADVRRGKIAAFVTDHINALYFTQVKPCDLALGSEVVGSGSLVLGLHPNSTIRGKLDDAMLKLAESGQVPDLRRKWFQDNNECDSEATTEGGRLSMAQAWSVFVIPAVGAAAGILIAAAEVFYYNKMFVGVQSLRQDLNTMGARVVLSRRLHRQQRSISKSLRFGSATDHTFDVESPVPDADDANSQKSAADKAAPRDGSGSVSSSVKQQQQQQQQQGQGSE
ncbi:hypothetical protein OEZ86_001556 [Tetradesmus obliquus]|nr:hypothetical protein OEZ86_001556 [Tetradesmus obliquus]